MRFSRDTWRWALGLVYIVAVATIWIAASYVVQSVVDSGVSPFLITYICNSLFVVLIPIVAISQYLEVVLKGSWHWFQSKNGPDTQSTVNSEEVNLLVQTGQHTGPYVLSHDQQENISLIHSRIQDSDSILSSHGIAFSGGESCVMTDNSTKQVNTEEHWTHCQVAKVSLLICPFWFFAQLTFNLSLKYTTVTSNTILSSSSSLFTFLVAVAFLGEKFTWVKLVSVLLCMGGTIMVSLSDSSIGLNAIATNPLLGDILALISAGLYAVYITLIRQKLTDERKNCQASTAQFLGFLGLFNLLMFFPVLLVLNFTELEPLHKLSWNQLGLIGGKDWLKVGNNATQALLFNSGLLDNVLSDYLWAEAIHLTTTTVATAGLTIQVPIAAVMDSLTGHAPHLLDYIGAIAVMVGFTGINIPSDDSVRSLVMEEEQETTSIDASSER